MGHMLKRVAVWAATSLVAGFAVFFVYGSWQTYTTLDRILTVGAPTAQNSGWPTPETAADIGYRGNPMEAYGYPFEEIALETELGAAPAWLVPAQGGTLDGTWGIVVHGIGGRRENGYRFLPAFHEAGIPTMLISYRNDEGTPASPDGRYAFGLTEWRDLEAAAQYALDNGAKALVLLGESMGGGIVGQFLRRSGHAASVKAVVLDAAAIDYQAILVSAMKREGAPLPDLLSTGGMWIAAQRQPFDLREAVTTDDFAAFDGPIFVSHGAGDRIVPVELSDELMEKRSAPSEYLRTRADHILSWKEDPARYDAALLAFLRTVQ